jgi:PAS domain S-box-containing protein
MIQSFSKTILLVEDQVIIAMSQIKLLNKEGFQVVHAFSGKEAIEIMNQEGFRFHLILMDIDLGHDIDGGETAKIISASHNTPIIFLSSQTEREIIQKTEEITSYGYILKTAGAIVLIASIKMALKLAESNERLRESENKFLKAFQYSPVPISINDISDKNRFVDCNEAFELTTGYSRNEVIGMLPESFDFYAYPEERQELLRLLKANGHVKNFKHSFKDRAGKITERILTMVQVNISDKPYYLVFDIINS